MSFFPRWYERRLRLFETGYGRGSGWYLMRDGVRLASLTDCQWEEMFWDSYQIEPLTDDPELNRSLLSDFWTQDDYPGVYFVNRDFPEIGTDLFIPAGNACRKPGRVIIRGLYLCPLPAMPWDYVILWWRRRRSPKNAV